jgi:DNA primase
MDDIELIKSKINIVDLVGEYVPLKKAGVNYKGNCPFHGERTPSFMVSPERGIWHCFGCGRGGDQFKFLMEKDSLDFKDALEILAQKAGVTLSRAKKGEKDAKEQLYAANTKAAQLFNHLLTKDKVGAKALEYLHKRGLTNETIQTFNIGYAPNSWDTLTKFLRKRGFTIQEMVDAGLCVPSSSGCYDRFRGRIMFPLVDIREHVIGFSGRVLGNEEPKYINTPQTILFDKRRFLLGLNLTKSDIKKKNEAIIVEGEMDMLMSYQSGVKNVTASKGTAFTEEHIETLKKYTDTLSLCFDTDLAGDAAARRGIEMADRAGLNLKVIQVENAKDPADTVLKNPEKWFEAVENATPIYDYYLQSADKRYKVKNASDKKAVFAELLPIWSKIADPITKEHYTEKLAALLMLKDDIVRKELDIYTKNAAKGITVVTTLPQPQKSAKELQDNESKPYDRRGKLEEYLITLLLHIPQESTYVPNFPETLFTREELKQIYVLLVIFLDTISFKGHAFKITEFTKMLPPDLIYTVDKLYLMQVDEKLETGMYWQKEIELVISELKKMLIKASLEKLSLQIKNAQEFEKTEALETLNKIGFMSAPLAQSPPH